MSAERLSREQRVARISALVDTIRTADAELRTLLDDQVDLAALRRGLPPLFLHEAQQLDVSETSQREIAHELQCTLDAVPAHIVLLDGQGVIIAVNEAWRRFASDNALSDLAFSIGTNYLDVCDRATGDCSEEARASAEGIRQVLRRETESFSLEYSCHSPDQRRWFRMMVTPVLDTRLGGAVVTHVDMTERRLAEEAIRTSEARFRAIVENEPECVKLLAPDGRLLDINPAGLRLIEADEPGQVIGRSLIELIHPEDRQRYLAFHHRVSLGEAGQEEFRSVGLKGTERRMDTHAVPLRDADGHVSSVLSVTRDVTARTRAEAAARSRARHHEALARIGVAATRHTSLEAVFEVTVRDVAWALEVEYCKILKLAPDGSHLRLVAGVGWRPGLVGVATVGVDKDSQAGYALLSAGPIFVDDLATETRFSAPDLLRQHDVRSGGSVALRLGHAPWGVLGAHTRRTRAFDQADDDFLQSVASVLTIVIERVSVQRTLVHSEGRLREAQRIAGLGSWELDLATDRLSWSGEVFRIFGIDPGASPASYEEFLALVHPDDRDRVQAAHRDVTEGRSSLDIEYRIVHPDGTARIVRARGETIKGAQGHTVVLAGTVLDITDLRHSQTQVDTANAVMREAQRIARLGSWDFDVVSGRLTWSEETCRLFGTTPDAFAGTFQAFADFILPEDRPHLDRAHALVTPDAPHVEAEYRIRRPDGDVRWLFERGVVTFDEQGRQARRLGVVMDVTERRHAEEALRESEERFRLLSQATNDAIWDWNLVTNALWWNEGFETLFGFSRTEVESTIDSWTSRVHPDDRTRVVGDVHAAIDGGATSWSGEYRFLRRDGSYAYVLDRGLVIRDDTGRAVRMIGGMTDLSERKDIEERLREQAALLDRAQDAIVVRDLEHRVTYWNKSAERFYGWSATEVIGRSVQDLLYADPAAFLVATAATVENGEWMGEIQQRTKDGLFITIEGRWSLVRDDAGQPQSILAINTDVTDRKRLEQQFLRVQRMESIGTLAGGIAHDLNNVLAPIMMSIELLQLHCDDDDAREILDTIRASTERGAAMVSQVLSFARGMEGQRVRVQLKQLIDDLVRIVHDTFPKNIHVVTRVSPDLLLLEADPTQVHQVLLNLCVNARDAMPDGGTISIGAENLVIDEHYAAMNIEARVGPHVRLDVEDNGMGILPAVIHQIFDPFFTTKEVGEGTGLGLSTTMAIVKSHGGFIRVDSEPGMGARFRAYFPAHEHKGQTSMPVEQVLPRGRGETVLVVDDEPSIRQIARQTLEAFGYRVHVASNGADAVALFAQRVGEIDIALVDMMMPIMDGPATIRALRQIDQGLPIIGASGMTAHGGQAQATAAGVSAFLPKPYSADTLLNALAKILRHDQARGLQN